MGSACLTPTAAHGRLFVQSKKNYITWEDLPAPAFVTNRMEELKHFCQDAPSSALFYYNSIRISLSGETQQFDVYALDARKRIERFNNEEAESKKLTWKNGFPTARFVK